MDKRVETAARAMARYRLGLDSFISSLNPEIVANVRQSAEDKLWPSLVGAAEVMVEALDALEREPNARSAKKENADAPSHEGGPRAGSQSGQVAPTMHGSREPSVQVVEKSLDIGGQPAESRVEQVPVTSALPKEGLERLLPAESGATGIPAPHGERPLPPSEGKIEMEPPNSAVREGRRRWGEIIAGAKTALQREAVSAPPAHVKTESAVVQIAPSPLLPDVGERPAAESEPLSAKSSGANSAEHVATTATGPQNGRDRSIQVDSGPAKITPQPEPSSDPVTEALRSALSALAATGISPRGKA